MYSIKSGVNIFKMLLSLTENSVVTQMTDNQQAPQKSKFTQATLESIKFINCPKTASN